MYLETYRLCIDLNDNTDTGYFNPKGYEIDEKRIKAINGVKYEIRLYKGDHASEYLVSEMKGDTIEGSCQLFNRGILSRAWTIKDGKEVVDTTKYDHGKVLERENWNSIIGKEDRRVIENTKDGLVMVIRRRRDENENNGRMIYRGEFDEDMNRNGYGMEYDRESGKVKIEGYWESDQLIRIVREFVADNTMIEFTGSENKEIYKRVPVYIGGYCVDNGSYKRHGLGYLIDENSGTATRESEWDHGKELRGADLHEGWYLKGLKESIREVIMNENPGQNTSELKSTFVDMHTSTKMKELKVMESNLVIPDGSYSYMNKLYLNEMNQLESLEIGDECFTKVNVFRIDGLHKLNRIKIGKNSFTQSIIRNSFNAESCNDTSQSFSITNCKALSQLIIGENSFSTFAGDFKLESLPSLKSIQIGVVGKKSHNFYSCSFVLQSNKSNEMMIR